MFNISFVRAIVKCRGEGLGGQSYNPEKKGKIASIAPVFGGWLGMYFK